MSMLVAGLVFVVSAPSPGPGSVEARYGVGLPPAPATAPEAKPADAAKPAEPRPPWQLNPPDRWYALKAGVELGFVGVVMHKIQFGQQGTAFDLHRQGGQDVLFPFFRFSGEFEIKQRHTLSFLIQPIKLKTTETLQDDLVVDDQKFAAGTPMAFKYDFGFYRFSYLYDFFKDRDQELAIGLAVQIRNATIDFVSRDGTALSSHRNIGVVPLLKIRGRWTPKRGKGVWIGGEIDGIYVRGKIVSGTRDYFEGALMDASVRVGFHVPRAGDAFVNVRYLGGGARGTESNPEVGDGYTNNWFHTMALSLGLFIR